jgi:hypothetical protein
MKISIATFGIANREAGWNSLQIEIEQKTSTLREVLSLARSRDGRTLLELIGESAVLKENFAIFLNGQILWPPLDLNRIIQSDARIAIVDFPFTLGGG